MSDKPRPGPSCRTAARSRTTSSPDGRDPVPLENRIRLVTCGSSGCQAARVDSLIMWGARSLPGL